MCYRWWAWLLLWSPSSVSARVDALAVTRALDEDPDVGADYFIGGGNTAILTAMRQLGRTPMPFIAHALDVDKLHPAPPR